jgi:hypothetical protein
MRSLEKVAQEKGMIKHDPVVKTAAKKDPVNLIPSDSLLDNLMKLCAGLRERGFIKQAEDVENNLVAFKQAQTMYDVSGEEGKDVVEFAHPEGSHKLEGLDAQNEGAVVEDILDQMAKSIDVVEKKPTGKLTESQKAIEAVKVILGATPLSLAEDPSPLYDEAKDAIEKFRSVYDTIAMAMGEEAGGNDQYFDLLKRTLDKKTVHQSDHFADSLTNSMNDLRNDIEPSFLSLQHSSFSPEQEQKWQSVQKYFPILKKYADRFRAVVSRIDAIEGKTQTSQESEQAREADPEMDTSGIVGRLNTLVSQLNQYVPKVSKYNSATSYINSEIKEIKDLIAQINQQGATPQLNNAVAEKEQEVKQFAATWKLAGV